MDTSKLKFKADIMDENAMKRALRRIAHEIIENNDGVENLRLVGIQRRGVTLAKMLREMIEQVEGVKLPLGVLDITTCSFQGARRARRWTRSATWGGRAAFSWR